MASQKFNYIFCQDDRNPTFSCSCTPSPRRAFCFLFPLQYALSSFLSLVLQPFLQFPLVMFVELFIFFVCSSFLLFMTKSLKRPRHFFLPLFETPLSVFELIFVLGQAFSQAPLSPFPLQFSQLEQLEKKKEKDEESQNRSPHPGLMNCLYT